MLWLSLPVAKGVHCLLFNIRLFGGGGTFHSVSILLHFPDSLYDTVELTLSWLLLLSCYLSNPILIFVLDLYIWHLPWSQSQEILMETSKKRKHENEEQIESSSISGSSIMVNFIRAFRFQVVVDLFFFVRFLFPPYFGAHYGI